MIKVETYTFSWVNESELLIRDTWYVIYFPPHLFKGVVEFRPHQDNSVQETILIIMKKGN